ncbi:protein-disulfide reductase DsbD family protein [Enterovibrio norvegicus]|uniref:Suppressor for copper-sensitivity B n=1 Tax=Enterovibrio norvegicus DSM 15893 TaxID=1121869 RepID=A0A1I5TT84_9GAMM|nr:protein-disulfide reductase DsbD domain-containing protein [Enterovibrio norvegicus]SFP86272.1 suppressor for copper-sensitivity B [Enterovibrio norvegicus DSM 15893]
MHVLNTLSRKLVLLIVSLSIALSAAMAAQAETPSTGWLTNPAHPPLSTRVVLTGSTNYDANTFDGFLEVQLNDDWKTYWRTPGEGGIAPSFDWQASENIKDITWHWPAPQRFDLLGIDTLGYKGHVIFPLTFTAENIQKPVNIKGKVTVSSCTTVCVLTDYPIDFTVTPAALKTDSQALHLFAQGMSNVPQPSPLIEALSVIWDENAQLVEITAKKTTGWQTPDVLIDGSTDAVQDTFFSVPNIQVTGNTLRARFDASSWMGKPELSDETLKVTFLDDSFIAEHASTAKRGIATSPSQPSFFTAILFAVLGGLILNIMPCVLPVLGMKLSSVISAQGLGKSQIRRQFIASAMGILFSFWVIAALISTLKLTGHAFGWGIQFQSPLFIGVMVAVTAIFAANMLGLFEIRLPSTANTWLASKGDNSYAGHFTQGMFATLLATPCSAPFLGTAVAFALTTNYLMLFVIFTALAFGMAMPWLLVAAMPSIAQRLPKPGRWMNRLKVTFGVMMLATSVWLMSLLQSHFSLGWVATIVVVATMIILWRTSSVYGRKTTIIVSALAMVLLVVGIVTASLTASKWASPLPADHTWEKLSSAQISHHVAQGKIVFVDVTADWCITCKANKIGVLLQEPVYSALSGQNIIRMQGDWTSPSDSVTQYLQRHGRYGVPFNIVYGPNAPNGISLPVILSNDAVLNAIKLAQGTSYE